MLIIYVKLLLLLLFHYVIMRDFFPGGVMSISRRNARKRKNRRRHVTNQQIILYQYHMNANSHSAILTSRGWDHPLATCWGPISGDANISHTYTHTHTHCWAECVPNSIYGVRLRRSSVQYHTIDSLHSAAPAACLLLYGGIHIQTEL